MKTAQQEFTEVIKGKNFMTPLILGYYKVGKYVVEVSKAPARDNVKLYGVTVLDRITKKRPKGLSKCFFNLEDAICK